MRLTRGLVLLGTLVPFLGVPMVAVVWATLEVFVETPGAHSPEASELLGLAIGLAGMGWVVAVSLWFVSIPMGLMAVAALRWLVKTES